MNGSVLPWNDNAVPQSGTGQDQPSHTQGQAKPPLTSAFLLSTSGGKAWLREFVNRVSSCCDIVMCCYRMIIVLFQFIGGGERDD